MATQAEVQHFRRSLESLDEGAAGKRQIARGYFRSNIADDAFNALPVAEQEQILDAFAREVGAPGRGLLSRAASAVGEFLTSAPVPGPGLGAGIVAPAPQELPPRRVGIPQPIQTPAREAIRPPQRPEGLRPEDIPAGVNIGGGFPAVPQFVPPAERPALAEDTQIRWLMSTYDLSGEQAQDVYKELGPSLFPYGLVDQPTSPLDLPAWFAEVFSGDVSRVVETRYPDVMAKRRDDTLARMMLDRGLFPKQNKDKGWVRATDAKGRTWGRGGRLQIDKTTTEWQQAERAAAGQGRGLYGLTRGLGIETPIEPPQSLTGLFVGADVPFTVDWEKGEAYLPGMGPGEDSAARAVADLALALGTGSWFSRIGRIRGIKTVLTDSGMSQQKLARALGQAERGNWHQLDKAARAAVESVIRAEKRGGVAGIAAGSVAAGLTHAANIDENLDSENPIKRAGAWAALGAVANVGGGGVRSLEEQRGVVRSPDPEDLVGLGAYAGGALYAFLNDLFFGKATVGKLFPGQKVTKALAERASTRAGAIAAQAVGEGVDLAAASVLHDLSNIGDAKRVVENAVAGFGTGAAFGAVRNLFPGPELTQRMLRVASGLVALDINRSLVAGQVVHPFDERSTQEKVVAAMQDLYFLWSANPHGQDFVDAVVSRELQRQGAPIETGARPRPAPRAPPPEAPSPRPLAEPPAPAPERVTRPPQEPPAPGIGAPPTPEPPPRAPPEARTEPERPVREAIEPARAAQRGEAEWLREFEDVGRQVAAAEKDPTEGKPTSLRFEEDWEAFSRARGYTEDEINLFRRWLELNEEGETVHGWTVDDLSGLARRFEPEPETPPPVEAPPPEGETRRRTGRPATLQHTEGADEVVYEIRESSELIPSHQPRRGFSRHPAYPANVQERPYHTDPAEQAKVQQNAQRFAPEFVISDNVDATNGPPVITPEGVVLGGNSRAMTLDLVYAQHPERAEAYKTLLKERAAQFGLDPAEVDQFQQPALVRVTREPMDTAAMSRRARLYNQPPTQALESTAEGVSKARLLSPETVQGLATSLKEFESLRSFLGSQKSRDFIRGLQRDGVITEQEAGRVLHRKTGLLTEDGKRMIEGALRGVVLRDADVVSAVRFEAPAVLNKVDRSLPALARVEARGEGWELGDLVSLALESVPDYRLSAHQTAESYLREQPLFPEGMRADPRAKRIFRALIEDTPTQWAKKMEEYAASASRDVRGQETLGFFKAETPEEAFDRIFGPSQGETFYSGPLSALMGGEVEPKEARARRQPRPIRFYRTRAQLLEGIEQHKEWRDWYDRHVPIVENVFGEDAQLFQDILAATSQRQTVKGNVTVAIKAYGQLKRGEPFTGYLDGVRRNLNRVREDEALRGPKIGEFGAGTRGDPNAIAVDRHVAYALFGTKAPSLRQIEAGKRRIRELAERTGFTPRETQAALWAFGQTLAGREPGEITDYAEAIRERIDQIAALRSLEVGVGGEGEGVSGRAPTGRAAPGRGGVELGAGIGRLFEERRAVTEPPSAVPIFKSKRAAVEAERVELESSATREPNPVRWTLQRSEVAGDRWAIVGTSRYLVGRSKGRRFQWIEAAGPESFVRPKWESEFANRGEPVEAAPPPPTEAAPEPVEEAPRRPEQLKLLSGTLGWLADGVTEEGLRKSPELPYALHHGLWDVIRSGDRGLDWRVTQLERPDFRTVDMWLRATKHPAAKLRTPEERYRAAVDSLFEFWRSSGHLEPTELTEGAPLSPLRGEGRDPLPEGKPPEQLRLFSGLLGELGLPEEAEVPELREVLRPGHTMYRKRDGGHTADGFLSYLTAHGGKDLGNLTTGRGILDRWIGLRDLATQVALRKAHTDQQRIAAALGIKPREKTAAVAKGERRTTAAVDAWDAAILWAQAIRRTSQLPEPGSAERGEPRRRNGPAEARQVIQGLRATGDRGDRDLAAQIERGLEIVEGQHPRMREILDDLNADLELLGEESVEAGLIPDVLTYYDPRYWDLPAVEKAREKRLMAEWRDQVKEAKRAGEKPPPRPTFSPTPIGRPKFAQETAHRLPRTFDSALDGVRAGYRLRIRGITGARAELMKDLADTLADRELVRVGTSYRDETADGELEDGFLTTYKPRDKDYSILEHPGFWDWAHVHTLDLRSVPELVELYGRERGEGPPEALEHIRRTEPELFRSLEKVLEDTGGRNLARDPDLWVTQTGNKLTIMRKAKVWAPTEWANFLNRIMRPSVFDRADRPLTRGARKVLDWLYLGKATLFAAGLFHHQALSMSWWLGTDKSGVPLTERVAPWRAAAHGYEMARGLEPIIKLGIRNGLTMFNRPDWDPSTFGRRRKLFNPGVLDRVGKIRQTWEEGLFTRFQTGLKGKAFAAEFANGLRREVARLGRPLSEAEVDALAARKAALVNADYGGLHFQRIGRSKTWLDLERFLLLAPDWTESNLRYVPLMERLAAQILNENQLMPESGSLREFLNGQGMDAEYVRFYGRALAYGVMSTISANIALNGWEDTKERFGQTWNAAKGRGEWSKLLKSPAVVVDITKVYDAMGIKPRSGTWVGWKLQKQFSDPLKFILGTAEQFPLLGGKEFWKHKAGLGTSAIWEGLEGRNWRDAPYLRWKDALRYHHLTAPNKYQREELFRDYWPVWMFDQVTGVAPIPLQSLFGAVTGETDALTAIFEAAGSHVGPQWPIRPPPPRKPLRFRD